MCFWIIVGGFAGAGKTAISRWLSAEFCIPRLGSDTLGRAIKNSAGIKNGDANAYWIAYDLLFCLCEEFVQTGVSAILDLTMGWEFLVRLDRSDIHWVDVDRPYDEVYKEVREYVSTYLLNI